MPILLRRLVPGIAIVALLAGCPDTLGKLCPDNTVVVGNYTLTLTLLPDASQCIVLTDAGSPADANPFANVAAQSASVCDGDPDGGGRRVFLALQSQVPRDSPIGDVPAFTFTTHNENVTQSPCGCSIDYVETITGVMIPATDAGIEALPDGGLTPVAALDGSVVDHVTMSGGASGCLCTLPCDLRYQLNGTRQ
jgi:hypothetical protein